jgi:hypothetical protein
MKSIATKPAVLVFTLALVGILTSCEKPKQPEQVPSETYARRR